MNSTVSGGTGPVWLIVMQLPGGVVHWKLGAVRSAGVMQAASPGAGVVHCTFPCANSVWKIAAEVSEGFVPGAPVSGTKICAICRKQAFGLAEQVVKSVTGFPLASRNAKCLRHIGNLPIDWREENPIPTAIDRPLSAGHFLTVIHRHDQKLLHTYAQLLVTRGVEGFITMDTSIDEGLGLPTVAVAGHKHVEGVTNIVLD